MGIPSYFSHIVKNYPAIIQKYVLNLVKVDNLYLDCNSIVYDSYAKLSTQNNTSIESSIIQSVIQKIEEYIHIIQPQKNVIIAFDGVAPVAKLDQQRGRRYKSWYDNQTKKRIFNKVEPDVWNTTSITPGTKFMQELNNGVTNYFKKKTSPIIIVSGSDVCGEGEHKIFEFIRNNREKHLEEVSVIYGLDADLIMLALNHLPVSPNLYLFRETPHFIQSIDASLEPDANYLMNIPELAKSILNYLETDNINKLYDYIFICFFLGNDFMPHFPAINIRTGGVDKMLQAYKSINKCIYDVNTGTIHWLNVRHLVEQLASTELYWIQQETKKRNRRENHNMPEDTPEQIYEKFMAIPTYERDLERYINPFKNGWQSRYYTALLEINGKERIQQVCTNYLEGLEWTMKYYTTGCPDWRWSYKYEYPPLLEDLLRYIPVSSNKEFIQNKAPKPVSQLVQLCYVLPRANLELLPRKLFQKLLATYPEWYKTDYEFCWAYCRYFWESHAQMEHIDIDELEQFITDNRELLM